MEKTLQALGEILLKALPTFFLVVFLYVYLRKVFFGPLAKVLAARREATEGARGRADAAFRQAEQKAAEYESAIARARAEIHQQQEAERQKAMAAHAGRIREAREQAETRLRQARESIAAEAGEARQSLGAQSEALSEQIVRAVLETGAAA